MCAGNNTSGSKPTQSPETVSLDGRRLFDILAAVAYLRSLGATSATTNFVRGLIGRGEIPHLKISKKFYVKKGSLDRWIETRERRTR
jgi:hypothetical protein